MRRSPARHSLGPSWSERARADGKSKIVSARGITIERVSDRSLNEMLLAGDLDGIISAREPSAFLSRDPRIVRLWPDYRVIEEKYFRDTGIFPIMHAVVIKTETLHRYPWVAMNLFKAFEEAKTNSFRHFLNSTTSRIPIAWAQDAALEAQKVLARTHGPMGLSPIGARWMRFFNIVTNRA